MSSSSPQSPAPLPPTRSSSPATPQDDANLSQVDEKESTATKASDFRPFMRYTRAEVLHLSKSPLVKAPEGMPSLKEWFGELSDPSSTARREADVNGSRDMPRERARYRQTAADSDEPGQGSTRPAFKSTFSQGSQMGNFRHQSFRVDRERDPADRDRDRESSGLKSLADRFDRDRLLGTAPGLPGSTIGVGAAASRGKDRDREGAPHLPGQSSRPVPSRQRTVEVGARDNAKSREANKKDGRSNDVEDWRRSADTRRDDDREKPEPRRERESSRTRRDRDRDEGRERDNRRDRAGDRDRERDEEARKWKDDGRRDDRERERKDRDSKEHPDSKRDRDTRESWGTAEDSSRNTNRRRERRPAEDEREREKEPAWMETYVPDPASKGTFLGGRGLDGELDGIQAWKKGLKEQEKKERDAALESEQEAERAFSTQAPSALDNDDGLDEIQRFRLMMKLGGPGRDKEEERREAEEQRRRETAQLERLAAEKAREPDSNGIAPGTRPTTNGVIGVRSSPITSKAFSATSEGTSSMSRKASGLFEVESSDRGLSSSDQTEASSLKAAHDPAIATLTSATNSAIPSASRTFGAGTDTLQSHPNSETNKAPLFPLGDGIGPSTIPSSNATVGRHTPTFAGGPQTSISSSTLPPSQNVFADTSIKSMSSILDSSTFGPLVTPGQAAIQQPGQRPPTGDLLSRFGAPGTERRNSPSSAISSTFDRNPAGAISSMDGRSTQQAFPSTLDGRAVRGGMNSPSDTRANAFAAGDPGSRGGFGGNSPLDSLFSDSTPRNPLAGFSSPSSTFDAPGSATSTSTPPAFAPGKGSRFAKFWEPKEAAASGHPQVGGAAGILGPAQENRGLQDVLAMLQGSSQLPGNRGGVPPTLPPPSNPLYQPTQNPSLHSMSALSHHHQQGPQHFAQPSNHFDSLYDSRFVADGMVPGLRPQRMRENSNGQPLFGADPLDDRLAFNVQPRLPPQQQTFDQYSSRPIAPMYSNQGPGGMNRNTPGLPVHGGPPYRGTPGLGAQHLPPGMNNLGAGVRPQAYPSRGGGPTPGMLANQVGPGLNSGRPPMDLQSQFIGGGGLGGMGPGIHGPPQQQFGYQQGVGGGGLGGMGGMGGLPQRGPAHLGNGLGGPNAPLDFQVQPHLQLGPRGAPYGPPPRQMVPPMGQGGQPHPNPNDLMALLMGGGGQN